jgi:hypothetical protein
MWPESYNYFSTFKPLDNTAYTSRLSEDHACVDLFYAITYVRDCIAAHLPK